MPQSVSLVRLLQKTGVFPQNNSTSNCFIYNTVVLEAAQHIANHESPRTTKLYDRRQDEISLDEVEKIAI